MHSKSSFTLIELLVVIAIVGILAGIIIVSMTNATESAQIAKSKTFSESIKHSIGNNLISEWNFDGNTNDSWGANNGTWSGLSGSNTAATYLSEENCIFGKCLSFDGTDDMVDYGNATNLNITGAITISLWIKPAGLPSALDKNWYIFGKGNGLSNSNSGAYALSFYKVNNTLYFDLASGDGVGNRNSVISKKTDWANKWYNIVATWDGTTSAGGQKLYINGVLDNKSTSTISALRTDAPSLRAGYMSLDFFQGAIDEIRLYNNSISVSQIREGYLAGLRRLLALNQMNESEFNQELVKLNTNFSEK